MKRSFRPFVDFERHFYIYYYGMRCTHLCRVQKKTFRENYWSNLGGRINPGRNYWMFGLIAGVRCEFEEALQPKGLPDNLGWYSEQDAHCYINDKYADDDNEYVTLETAKKWEGYGEKIIYHTDGKPWKVTHPDWHSHTWLTTEEFKNVVNVYNEKDQGKNKEVEYEALLSLMQSLESNDCEARLVIWFDN